MQVKARMRAGLEAGLKATGPSAIKMLPSFVCGKPDGTGQIVIYSTNFFLRIELLKIHSLIVHFFESLVDIMATTTKMHFHEHTYFLCFTRTWKVSFPGSGRDKLQGIVGGF